MELFGSRLLTVRHSCGRQDLAVLLLNFTCIVHFLSSVCCVPFSFSATPSSSRQLQNHWNLWKSGPCCCWLTLGTGSTVTARVHPLQYLRGGRWGFTSCKLVPDIGYIFTTFQMAEKWSKSLGSWPFCRCRCSKIISLLSCMHCVFDFQFLGEFLRD